MRVENSAVLLVDDELEICWALDRILQKIGCMSVSAFSGKEAVETAKRMRFDVALVDAKLPDADGIDVIRTLRAGMPGLRAILISGQFLDGDPKVEQWIQEGKIQGFISKPFSIAQVRSLVQQALDSKEPEAPPGSMDSPP